MRILYFECSGGTSGDMIISSLCGLLDDPSEIEKMIEQAGIPGVNANIEKTEDSKIAGIRMHITIDGEEEGHGKHHVHRSISDVNSIISNLKLPENVKEDALSIYHIIAQAESEVHDKPIDLVHFHEVGALDAIADIVGTCLLIDKLKPDMIISSPIRTGFGKVKCAHGILPVPAPATASIIKGLPVYAGEEEGEFCTPTGAAIIKHFTDKFARMPSMIPERMGIGIGHRKFESANMLRTFIGNSFERETSVEQIDCDIDDMTPEDLAGVIDILLDAGAIDAVIKPCIMKKGRPGFELTAITSEKDTDRISELILKHTTTIGVRIHGCGRIALRSETVEVETEYGKVRVKVSEGYGIRKCKPEFDDLKAISDRTGISITELRQIVQKSLK